jgi:hypothetical protein
MKTKNFRIIFYLIVGGIVIFLSTIIFVSVKFLRDEQKDLLFTVRSLEADEIDSILITDDKSKPNVYSVKNTDDIIHFVELCNNAEQIIMSKGRQIEDFNIAIKFKSGAVLILYGTMINRKVLFINDQRVGYEVMIRDIWPWFSKQMSKR